MTKLFDYIFYRWFYVYGKDGYPYLSGAIMVTLYQSLTIANLSFIIGDFMGYRIRDTKFMVGIIILFYLINYLRYERNFDVTKLESLWKNESETQRKLRFYLMIGYLIAICIIPWTYNFSTP